MGIYANGPDPTRVDVPGIAEAMRPALEAWMTGWIQIWDDRRTAASAYNATNDGGGTTDPQLVLDSGVNGALIQPVRQPSRVDFGGQPTAIVGVRFQVKRSAAIESGQVLRGGLRVVVLDGGNDGSQLAHLTFSLTEGIDSSLAWDRILDAVVVTGS